MKVVVQHLESERFFGLDANWVERAAARVFADSVQAITSCIQRNIRMVRLVAKKEPGGQELYFYPFGHDPATKAQRKKLRKSLQRNRQIREQTQTIQKRIDALLAGAKETKKKFPFKRKTVS